MRTTQRTQVVSTLTLLCLGLVAAFVTLAAPQASALAKTSAETERADRMVGSAVPDRILGHRGADRIDGRAGDDQLAGGMGRDRISGGPGDDRINAGAGSDASFGGGGDDRLRAVRGRDRLVDGGPGSDLCLVSPRNRSEVRRCETTRVIGGGPGAGGGIGGDPGTIEGKNCLGAAEDRRLARVHARVGRRDDDPPPTFSPGFLSTWITLNVSVDGVEANQIPVAIEEVCDVPAAFANEAMQLAGGSGIGILGSQTQVYGAGQLVTGDAATAALMGADTLSLRARLLSPSSWGADEDGAALPTFATGRIEISD